MKPKIVRITTLLDFGGQEQQYLSFAECKSLLKNDYIFAAIGHGGYAEKVIREKGFEVKIFNQNPSVSNIKNIWILFRWLRKVKPDIVHAAAAEANFHATIAAKMAGIKIVFAEEIGFPTHSRKARFVFKNLYRLTAKVICVSKAVKDFLVKINEIEPEKGLVLYNPVTKPNVHEDSRSDGFTIISVGRLEKIKNHQLLIKGFSKIENRNARLILVGDGRERANLEQLIADLNCQHNVTIAGFSSDPGAYLSKSDLFVLPSLSEGFGIAAVEAMLLGIPCLCSNVGGIPEFVTENETGWLFDPVQETVFFEKLNAITKLPDQELKRIGEQGKKAVQLDFTAEKYVERLERFYDEFL